MITSTRLLALLRNVGHWDSHVRQLVAVVIALVTFLLFIHHGRSPITHFIAIWDIYAIVVVLMAWVTICTANPRTIQRKARLQDSSRSLIFAFILVAACISLLAVILVLREHKALQKTGGNKQAAADMLRLKRTTLSAKVRSLEPHEPRVPATVS
jgi:uncharacterized membrane protein